MRLAALLLASLLLCVAGWGQAARRGYEAGKADTTASLTPQVVVVIDTAGSVRVYGPGQPVQFAEPARAQAALLIQPAW
jgi:hypothetical protein